MVVESDMVAIDQGVSMRMGGEEEEEGVHEGRASL